MLKRQSQLQQTIILFSFFVFVFFLFFFLFFFFLYFPEKTSLDISCESSAWQMSHMKCQDLFSLKKKKKENLECRLLQILLGTLRVNMKYLFFK